MNAVTAINTARDLERNGKIDDAIKLLEAAEASAAGDDQKLLASELVAFRDRAGETKQPRRPERRAVREDKPKERAQDVEIKADAFFAKEDWAAAAAAYDAVLGDFDFKPKLKTYVRAAEAHFNNKDFVVAAAIWATAGRIATRPLIFVHDEQSVINIPLKRAACFAQAKIWHDAAEAAREAVTVEPTSTLAHAVLGLAYYNLGMWTHAIGAFNEGLAHVDGENKELLSDFLFNRAMAATAAGKHELAKGDMAAAQVVYPGSTAA